jgi:predicted Zn-dependent peptidase
MMPPSDLGPRAEKTVLPNGIRVLTERIEHVDSVSLGVWAMAGSRNDPPGREGMTHLLEHMCFKGTGDRSTLQIAEAIDDIGGHVNGVTDREEMSLFARTVGEQMEPALELLFDLFINSVSAEGEVVREREVVLQEIGHVRDAAEEWMHELVPQTIWAGHSLGRPLMGTPETIASISPEEIQRHHREEVLAADRLLITAAGRVDHARVVDVAAVSTALLKAGLPRPQEGPPEFSFGERLVRQPGAQAHFCLAVPGAARTDPSRHAFSLLDVILGGGNSSRLFQEIRERRGLSYGVGSYLQSYREAGLFVITAGTAPGNLQLVLGLVEHEIARLRADGPTEEELTRAKVQLKVVLAMAAESTGFRMQHLALSEICWGRVVPFGEIIAGVDRVSAEDVHGLSMNAFLEDQRSLVAIGPLNGEGRPT